MKNPQWFVREGGKETGPFGRDDLIKKIMGREFSAAAEVKLKGTDEWRPINDCLTEIANDPAARKSREEHTTERRLGCPRIPQNLPVSMVGTGAGPLDATVGNLSFTGAFVATGATHFRVGTSVRLKLALNQQEHVLDGQIIRHNASSQFAVGYGVKFESLARASEVALLHHLGFRPLAEFNG